MGQTVKQYEAFGGIRYGSIKLAGRTVRPSAGVPAYGFPPYAAAVQFGNAGGGCAGRRNGGDGPGGGGEYAEQLYGTGAGGRSDR